MFSNHLQDSSKIDDLTKDCDESTKLIPQLEEGIPELQKLLADEDKILEEIKENSKGACVLNFISSLAGANALRFCLKPLSFFIFGYTLQSIYQYYTGLLLIPFCNSFLLSIHTHAQRGYIIYCGYSKRLVSYCYHVVLDNKQCATLWEGHQYDCLVTLPE